MDKVPLKVQEIVGQGKQLIDKVDSTFDGGDVYTFEEQLRLAASLTDDRPKKLAINGIMNDLKDYYRGSGATKMSNDAQIIVEKDDMNAWVTLIPPRSGGHKCNFNEVVRELNSQGATFGLNLAAIGAACEKMSKKDEMVLRLHVAKGVLPKRGEDAGLEYSSKVFDKNLAFDDRGWLLPDFYAMLGHVDAGQAVARILPPGFGQPGYTINGREVQASCGLPVPVELGTNVKLSSSGKEIVAVLSGYPVLEDKRLEVIPFYIVGGDANPSVGEISFDGNVLVRGNVTGPIVIKAEDIYIEGNAEAAHLCATGDIFVRGGIIGKNACVVEADGRVSAKSISDSIVEALGDVVVRNSITYSDVTSNSCIIVKAEMGIVLGGSIAALKEIVARSIGSDFGTFTKTLVGKDFLTPKRIEKMEKRLKDHEQNLAKIEQLKQKLSDAHVDVFKLPPEKQDIYLSILQHESKTREQMSSLKRSKDKFQKAVVDFLSASIKVIEKLHPPVRVQIGEAIQEIRERMDSVVLSLDNTKQITTKFGDVSGDSNEKEKQD
jgi:uncharacterized protein (DUF342 family)